MIFLDASPSIKCTITCLVYFFIINQPNFPNVFLTSCDFLCHLLFLLSTFFKQQPHVLMVKSEVYYRGCMCAPELFCALIVSFSRTLICGFIFFS